MQIPKVYKGFAKDIEKNMVSRNDKGSFSVSERDYPIEDKVGSYR